MRNIFSKEPMDKDSFIEIIKTSSSDSEKYNSFFKPDNHLINIFESSKLDFFYKIYFYNNLCGYFSLRGLDEGYKIPRFGIYVFEEYKSNKIGHYALAEAIKLSQFKKYEALDLKVNKKNIRAIEIYKLFGFKKIKVEEGEDVYRLELKIV